MKWAGSFLGKDCLHRDGALGKDGGKGKLINVFILYTTVNIDYVSRMDFLETLFLYFDELKTMPFLKIVAHVWFFFIFNFYLF